jgi:hypothetical protein
VCRILGFEETSAVVLYPEFCARPIGVVLHSLTSLCVALALNDSGVRDLIFTFILGDDRALFLGSVTSNQGIFINPCGSVPLWRHIITSTLRHQILRFSRKLPA